MGACVDHTLSEIAADRRRAAKLTTQPPRQTHRGLTEAWRAILLRDSAVDLENELSASANRSWHHSPTLPYVSKSPKSLGLSMPTGQVWRSELREYQA